MQNLSKIEQETEVFKGRAVVLRSLNSPVNVIDKSVSKAIVQARQNKNLSQKELATVRHHRVNLTCISK